MSHGFTRAYTKTLPKFWEKSKKRTRAKHWSAYQFYQQNPDAAKRRKLFESGERQFDVIWHELNGERVK